MKKKIITSPALSAMVAKSNAWEAQRQQERHKRDGVSQNCRVGAKYTTGNGLPPAQAKAIFYKPDSPDGNDAIPQSFVDRMGASELTKMVSNLKSPVDSDGCNATVCPGPEKCVPAGRRSRVEWCSCGNVIK